MENLDKIDIKIEKIRKLWKAYPDLRLGQLFCNVTSPSVLYYIEDDALINFLSERYNVNLNDVKLPEKQSESMEKVKNRVDNNNRIYIHDVNGKIKAVFEQELDGYLKTGWKLGRKEK